MRLVTVPLVVDTTFTVSSEEMYGCYPCHFFVGGHLGYWLTPLYPIRLLAVCYLFLSCPFLVLSFFFKAYLLPSVLTITVLSKSSLLAAHSLPLPPLSLVAVVVTPRTWTIFFADHDTGTLIYRTALIPRVNSSLSVSITLGPDHVVAVRKNLVVSTKVLGSSELPFEDIMRSS
ncbi:hypothetical protein BDY19DRAFT_717331 [Irpex rosettiformis]|uniref:Uncharacterized protein n=1 Tax=Irpex rosettiformis TaxID=378272 RepID=A0ACB8U877_9APHY|nr:hypothetical protein BDY19DRAFT_717331 [Irpex rosettiformis]